MLIEIIAALLLGCTIGTFTGLIPGIHINLIGITLVALSVSVLSNLNPIFLGVFIVSMAIAHTFIDFIPSIFLGCPDTDTELSILPGHELLKKGQGYEAIILTAVGSLAAIIILILLIVPSFLIIPKIYNILQKIMVFVLIAVSILLVSLERKRLNAFFVFVLTGALGLSVLNLGVKEPLLPLLTGLFGASTLILSIKTNSKIPEQKIEFPKLRKKLIKPLFGALIASPISSLLPGLGSGQAAILGNTIAKTDRKGFLILLGATNTIVMGFSFFSLYLISRTRTGAAVAISEILGAFSTSIFILLFFIIAISGVVSFFLTIYLAKIFSKKINKINYPLLSKITLAILFLIVILFSGISGIIVLLITTLTGIYCISLKVRRTNMMGCLLIPTIIFYLAL